MNLLFDKMYNITERSFFCAILFADISRSTQLYEILGDKEASNLVVSTLSQLSSIAEENRGTFIKKIGDEILCIFPSADHALDASKKMHKSLNFSIKKKKFGPLNIHIGIHFGIVISDGNDIFGDAVNIAARVISLSKERQTLITGTTKERLDFEKRCYIRYLDSITLKGKIDKINVYEYIWDDENTTVLLEASKNISQFNVSMELIWENNIIIMDENRPFVTIGRQSNNDFILCYENVSRIHACLEYKKEKFIITDKSSNGTHIQFDNGEKVHIKLDEAILSGSGFISAGRKASSYSPGAVRFYVNDSRR